MKKLTLTLIIMAAFTSAQAQPAATTTGKGFWVVESNIRTPKSQIVLFYDDTSRVVYKETIAGKKIPYHRRAMQKKLNQVLAYVINRQDSLVQTNLLAATLLK